VPSDTNGQLDVYEYEDGQPSLISSGTSSAGSALVGASESGDDVFFSSRQALIPGDTGQEGSVIYDARVDGGTVVPSSPPTCTTADACRAPVSPQPSIYGAPASATFSGAGNLTPPVEAKPQKKVTPKKKAKKKACKRNKRKRARCAARSKGARAKAMSHKGGNRS